VTDPIQLGTNSQLIAKAPGRIPALLRTCSARARVHPFFESPGPQTTASGTKPVSSLVKRSTSQVSSQLEVAVGWSEGMMGNGELTLIGLGWLSRAPSQVIV